MFRNIYVSHRTRISCLDCLGILITRTFSTQDTYFQKILVKMSVPLLHRSVESILDVFNKDENKDLNEVKELLNIYNNVYDQHMKSKSLGDIKRYPLIVLEGLDGSGKTTMGRRLAEKVHGQQWRTPPESVCHLRNIFDNNKILRTAFYSLGNYVAALEVQLILKLKPVVMDRYWHSTAAYAIAQAVQDDPDKYVMPSEGHDIYCWPGDLFKPDVVILLNVSEEVRLERHSRRKTYTSQEDLLKSSTIFRQNVLQAYRNMYNPGVQIVDGNDTHNATLKKLQAVVNPLL